MVDRVSLGSEQARHVDAYIQYHQLVGQSDNGKMMSEQEFEQYKKKMIQNAGNRLHVTWQNSKGKECKTIGPSSKCYCDHRYKEHDYVSPQGKMIKCKMNGCKCKCFSYIPLFGSQDMKCVCKHSYSQHDPNSKKCKCGGCQYFTSTWSCQCGQKLNQHETVMETKQEREMTGKPVNDNPMSIGGISKFGDMVGYEDSYQKQIEDMGGISGAHNRQAPIGYNNMQAIGGQQQKMLTQNQYQQQNSQQQNQLANIQQGQLNPLQNQVSAYELFMTPHSFQKGSGKGSGCNTGPKYRAIKKY
ncbi:hypothetical protein PPERSA_00670 [Pseudocohnilembus persalinus]|uniref:Protein FAM221A n=1 Tax=Pseudocohnilembus persalinus TaxID=266149 RepID=A0A0V0QSN8_PSEPJ|nr:hypothetical protein PPERSA_00670 [Pseudocohnilembus persalinus]|eukprot:KRX05369.1 hypothetical protein PPERSA_00670 [Pseudocohnilembus persalinus]